MKKKKKTRFVKIALGSDHAGYNLKRNIHEFLEKEGYKILNFGTDSKASVDYPDFANSVARSLRTKKAKYGILVCGSGTGMAMDANRHKNIRAALCQSVKMARLSREHNNANILAFGGRFITKKKAINCIRVFLDTDFSIEGRHRRRIKKIS